MLVEMQNASGGGGSGAVSDTTAAVSTSQTAITINTGLSEINQFVWFAKAAGANKEYFVVYDKNTASDKHSYATPGGSQGLYNTAFAANAYGDAVITSITGGTVVVTTARNGGAVETGHWFAK